MAGGVDVLSSVQSGPTNLRDSTGNPTYWTNNDTLLIPSTFAGLPIAIEDSGGSLTPIAADEIHVQAAGVTLEGETTADELYVDPANPTSLVADSGDDMTITAAVAPLSSGTTVINTTGNAGGVVLSGSVSVHTITANAGSVEVAANADATVGRDQRHGRFLYDRRHDVDHPASQPPRPSTSRPEPSRSTEI